MVEYTLELDSIFGALADPTRRDILRRVASKELSVGQIAEDYSLTFAAVSKHLKVLEKAKLVIKSRVGRQQFVHAHPAALKEADDYLERFRQTWETRLDSLDNYLNQAEGGMK